MDEMMEAEIWSIAHIDQGDAVLLRPLGSDTVVPIFIGHSEAQAILLGLGDIKVRRPLTSDFFLEMTHRLRLTLFRVEIHELREDTFYARLLLFGREFSEAKPLILDSRPSDALALAVREKCAVYIAPQVLDQAGVPADLLIEEMGNQAPVEDSSTPLTTKRRRLQAELEEAVETESYERAAEIRDLLILLDQDIEQERRGKEAP
ncbi:MAG: bifunctional nuclease family protein [Treponema sp.]|jgi:bifunctional DNase/RNase|nr:bifunctional nuclease family protein [Treponema sp.]